jgi:hypothetical protein
MSNCHTVTIPQAFKVIKLDVDISMSLKFYRRELLSAIVKLNLSVKAVSVSPKSRLLRDWICHLQPGAHPPRGQRGRLPLAFVERGQSGGIEMPLLPKSAIGGSTSVIA